MTNEASLLDNFCYAMRKMPEMEERSEYIKQMITIRDIVNQLATAEEKGLAKGRAEGRAEGEANARRETALSLLKMGMDLKTVSEATPLPLEEVLPLQQQK